MSILDETMPLVFLWDARLPECELVARTPHGFIAWSTEVGLTEVDCMVITHYMQGCDFTRVVNNEGWKRSPFAPGPIQRGIAAATHSEREN